MLVEFKTLGGSTFAEVEMPSVPDVEDPVTFDGLDYRVFSRDWRLDPGYRDETGNVRREASVSVTVVLRRA